MSAIEFVQNYDDLSTDKGFQFRFHCDRCGNGYMSAFQTSALGVAGSLLGVAGSIFGGVLNSAANSAYDIQRAVGGPAHDNALRHAVAELKEKFKQCRHCGKWVCPEVCWNETRQLCLDCAPDLALETAAAQAQVARDQIFEKARSVDLVAGVDMSREAAAVCTGCGAAVGAAKFCPECGAPVLAKIHCTHCGTEMLSSAKFCPECGTAHAKKG